jgi:hypothetical protein
MRRSKIVDREITQRAVQLKLEIAQSPDVVFMPFAGPVPCTLQGSVERGQNLRLAILEDVPGGVLSLGGYGPTGSLQYPRAQGLELLKTLSQWCANILLEGCQGFPCLALDRPFMLAAPVKAEGYREVRSAKDDGNQDPNPLGGDQECTRLTDSAQGSLLANASVSGSKLYSTARRIWETRVGLP